MTFISQQLYGHLFENGPQIDNLTKEADAPINAE